MPLPQPLLGAHESIAGGIHTAFGRAVRAGCDVLQIFTKNGSQWAAKPLSDEDVANYKTASSETTVTTVITHASYLINLAASNGATLGKSRSALEDELRRCERLGIPLLVVHPGAHMGAGEGDGILRIADSLDQVHAATPGFAVKTVLETTAGQGTTLGHTFEQLRRIRDSVADPGRVMFCLDTCHVFAAGYDIRTENAYARTMDEFADVVGIDHLAVIHTNDSKKELGSRVDRHEHIGEGAIGLEGFRHLINDPRLAMIPKILETEKGEDLAEDIRNLAVLRGLYRKPVSGRSRSRRS